MLAIKVLCAVFCVMFGVSRMADGVVPAEVTTGLAFVLFGLVVFVVAIVDEEKPWWQGY